MLKFKFIFILLVGLLLKTAALGQATEKTAKVESGAQSQPKNNIVITANQSSREGDYYELIGNVQVAYQGEHLKAQRAFVNLRSQQVEAFGNVEVVTSGYTIRGQQVYLDYENNTGLIYDGYVLSGPVIFQGSMIKKSSVNEFYVVDGDYTTCTTCPPAWNFTGTSIRAELGGYAFIRNTVLKFGRLPVLWLPYLIVPLKSDRQSGLLTPEFELSDKGGWAYSQPFFWAIDRSTDATITAKNYDRRGLKGLVNYRYVLTDQSYGNIDTALIRDRVFINEERYKRFHDPYEYGRPFNRWFLHYDHLHELPEGFTHRAQINLASDLQYTKDFPLETYNNGDSHMENRVSVSKNSDSYHTSVDASYYTNLLKSDPLTSREDSVQRLPELRFSTVTKPLGQSGFYYSVDLNYANFTRAGPAYDDLVGRINTTTGRRLSATESTQTSKGGPYINFPRTNCTIPGTSTPDPNFDRRVDCYLTPDGVFNPDQDLLRTGQRLEIAPSLYNNIILADGVDLFTKFTHRESHYRFDAGEDRLNVRRYWRVEMSGQSYFSGIFGDLENPKANLLKHEIIPKITYTTIPWIQHARHPFFGYVRDTEAPFTNTLTLNDEDLGSDYGVQFDFNDRIYDRELVTFSVLQNWIYKTWDKDKAIRSQVGSLRVSQSYDAYQDRLDRPNKQPWSDLVIDASASVYRFGIASTFNYFPYHNVTNVNSRLRYNVGGGSFLQAGLIRRFTVVPGQEVNRDNRIEDINLSTGINSKYINLLAKAVYDNNDKNPAGRTQLKSWSYIAQIKPPGNCWLITFTHGQIIGGERITRLAMDFSWDGQPKAPIPSDALEVLGF